jgi:pimeloyl-ACP methyl ester carboxylesterase
MMVKIPLPPGVERCTVDTHRGAVAALRAKPESANGRVSVMVCGFMATKEDFREMLPLLSRAGYDAWAYDHPGQHGGEFGGAFGEIPDDRPGRYTTQSLADQLREVIRAVSPGEGAHVVGHCFGGFIARAAALDTPGLTRTLTFLSCGPSMRGQQARKMLAGMDYVLINGGPMLLWPLLKRALAEDDQVTRELCHAKLATVNPHYLSGVAQSMKNEADRTGDVAAVGIRTLVVHGSREKRLWRPSDYADMARDLRADLVVIDKAGHHVHRDQPDSTARSLTAFWARAEAGTPACPHGGDARAGVGES